MTAHALCPMTPLRRAIAGCLGVPPEADADIGGKGALSARTAGQGCFGRVSIDESTLRPPSESLPEFALLWGRSPDDV